MENKKLYADHGYLNIKYVVHLAEKNNISFIFIVGSRGDGKTVSALKYALENDIKFIYMRRTQSQLDLIKRPEYNPFTPVNVLLDTNVNLFSISKNSAAAYESEIDENNKIVPVGDMLGLTLALSTIANIRSFDASYVDLLIYDEFIPEAHERLLKHESEAFFNAIETIARNRELKGQKPLLTICCGNANNISNPYFISLNLVGAADKMMKTGREIHIDHERGLMLLNLCNSPISRAKEETTLYRLTRGSGFFDMAINNAYVGVCKDMVKPQDIKQYKIYLVVGELAIYKHKSQDSYYICNFISGTPKKIYTTSINSLREFRMKNHDLWIKYCTNKIFFENFTLQVVFEKYVKMAV